MGSHRTTHKLLTHLYAAMQNTWLVFLACCALGVLAEDKAYHYKEVPLQATQRAKTPLLINALAPRIPFLSPYYPGIYYPGLTYPTHLLTAQPVIARQAPKVAYSIPAEERSDDLQGRTSPARDYTKYFGVIPNKGLWKPEGDGIVQKVAIPDQPVEGRSPSSRSSYQTSITLCYFVGDDILKSHLMYNKKWAFVPKQSTSGLTRYINDLTLAANKLLGQDNFQLAWLGDGSSQQGLLPFSRHSPSESLSDEHLDSDVKGNAHRGCDANIFLLFNDFATQQVTDGFKYSGLLKGAPCDGWKGEGYAVVADQGYSDDVWVGPQVLAHFLLRLLTADICHTDPNGHQGWSHSCFCPDNASLLNPYVRPGAQYLDKCAVDKLNQSNISSRQCLRDAALKR